MTGAAKATSTPAAHPKRTIALAAKTNDSETPPLFGPSIGTGYLLASVDAASSAATPSSMETLCVSLANEAAARITEPSPSKHTGTTIGARRVDTAPPLLPTSGLPLPVVEDPLRVTACDGHDESDNDQDRDETGLPFEHFRSSQV